MFLVGACTCLVLPIDLFVVQRGITASAVCMVQTHTGIAILSSRAQRLQFFLEDEKILKY